nr:hypothetical protein CFP56_46092 [Quercus suber]
MASHHPVIIFLLSLVADQCGGVEIGVWGLAQRSVFGCGVEIDIGRRDRRWVWDVEIAVGHGGHRWAWDVEIAVGHGDRRCACGDRCWALGVEIGAEIGLWVLFIYGASFSFMGLILLGICWSFVGFVLAVVGDGQ